MFMSIRLWELDITHLSIRQGQRELALILVVYLHFHQDCVSDPWGNLTLPAQYEVCRSNLTNMEEAFKITFAMVCNVMEVVVR